MVLRKFSWAVGAFTLVVPSTAESANLMMRIIVRVHEAFELYG
jgi:hypothetical protein